MPTRNAPLYSIALIVTDAFALLAAFTLAYVLRVQFDTRPLVNDVYALDFFLTFLSIVPLWIAVFAMLGLYRKAVYSRNLVESGRLFVGALIGILIVLGYAFIINEPIFPARLVALYALIISFLMLLFSRKLVHAVHSQLYRFNIGVSRVLVVGNSQVVSDIATHISDTKHSGYKVVAIAGPKKLVPKDMDITHFSSVSAALNKLDVLGITTIIQTDLYEDSAKNERILDAAQLSHISYNFIPGESKFYTGKSVVDVFLGYPMISISQTPLTGWGVVGKRIFDIVVGCLILIIATPLILLIALLQKIFNPGPVLYVSRRLTRFSQPFDCLKFRTMGAQYGGKDAAVEFRAMGRDDLVAEYEKYRKVKHDPRITWFGKFLRTTSLDELPQLFNVIKGDLSLVGPRAILPQEMQHFKRSGALLHSVKSGVTGLWQVSGRSHLPFEKRVELELYYAQNWSFWMDIKILFRTLKVVFTRDGAE